MVRDLEVLPQDSAHYIPDLSRELISQKKQNRLFKEFKKQHFAPWDRSQPKHDTDILLWGFDAFEDREVYGENHLPLSEEWWKEMRARSDISGYPSRHEPAITVDNASMRVFPTQRPVFRDPEKPGQGFPFDLAQNSLIPAGTPVLITHIARDGNWIWVETEYVAGWMPASKLARVGQEFMHKYRDKDLAGFMRDETGVFTRQGNFVFTGRIGTVLPLDPEKGVWVPVRDEQGKAELIPGEASQEAISELPLRATGKNFARVLNSMLGQAYGWGGLYSNRDCSALLQDIYRMFGIYLPRNSADQKEVGKPMSLEGLSQEKKLELIREKGQPLLTILYMPGHVMLYLGQDPESGQPVVYHSLWGLRISRFLQDPGRHVIGRTVITSLKPGQELVRLARPEGLLIHRLSHLTVVADSKDRL